MSQGIFKRAALPVMITLALAGCSLAPKYERPAAPVPVQYPWQSNNAGAQATNVGYSADLGWSEFFRDPQLRALIALSLENNRDMRIAVERIQEARAQYGIVQSDRLPTLGIGGNAQITRNPPDVRANGPDSPSVSRYYQAGVGMTSFELDFFGRVKNLSEAAYQQYLATEQASRTVHINLVAQVAEAYFRLRTAQQLEMLAEKTLQSRQNTYALANARFEAGVASALDLSQAKSQLDSVRADRASLQRAQAQAQNALHLLLGTEVPADLPPAAVFGRDQVLAVIPVGLPSDLLERRPDIMGAENVLLSANANIGAARAAFFPNISITGLLGFASPQLGGLFSSGNRFWQFSPQIQMPIFSGGVMGNLDLAKARKNIAVSQYEKAIQTAFREVADALAGEETYGSQLDALRSLEASASETLKLATLRYETGIDSFLQVQ
ncbi:MAG TPA: efflux transporter outer membrane subunit, partial [Candidimonas sp.]|nr:efflux transporter outer membrane subunit [Candidimonas sp.]